jgi:ketosteroid isomerase-like protein
MSAEENMALARRFIEVRVKGDLDAMDEMLAPNFVSHTELLPGQQPGREGYKKAVAELTATGSNTRYLIEDRVAGEDRMVTRFCSGRASAGELGS